MFLCQTHWLSDQWSLVKITAHCKGRLSVKKNFTLVCPSHNAVTWLQKTWDLIHMNPFYNAFLCCLFEFWKLQVFFNVIARKKSDRCIIHTRRSSQLLWFGADCVCLKGQIWVSLCRAVSSLCPPGRMSFHCGFDTTVTSTHTHLDRQTDCVSVC